MEPKMISLKVLCTAAAMALVLPTASFAQSHPIAGGGGVHPGGGVRPGGGGSRPGGGGWHGGGGGWHGGGGGWHGGGGGWHGGGFIPGAVAGAIVGGAIASAPYGYYGGPGYYAPGYYDDQYYDDQGPVVAAPGPGGGDGVAYCMQTYRSYDPNSGTYLGYDGQRHPCP
jgi:BA14K-like protein